MTDSTTEPVSSETIDMDNRQFVETPIRVLIVDDEIDFLKTVSKIFRKRGFSTATAGGGEEALALLTREGFDVVVLDVKMPGIDGMETLRRIRQAHPETEVIMLTGHASTQDGVEGIRAGAYDYIAKPVEIDHLTSKIQQAHEKIQRLREKQKEKAYRMQMAQRMSAAERLASLGTLATGVAHEINNPLAIIRESAGWMEMLLAKPQYRDLLPSGELDHALKKIQHAVDRATRITHELLGFVRAPAAVPVEADLRELAEESIDLVCRTISRENIELVVQVGAGSTVVRSDPYRIRQILMNLINNAVHAVSPSGRVTVSIDPETDGVRITVIDDGVGIPEEHMEKIFEPFFTTKSHNQGTGLGLFVTRGIVERLGGRILVESKPGRGSRFSFRLPREKTVPADTDAPAPNWIETIRNHF